MSDRMSDRPEPIGGSHMPEVDTERLLADWFRDDAPRQEPPVLLPAVLARTAMTRRRPRWLTRDWWLDILGIAGGGPATSVLSIGFVAILTALALAGAFALVPGGGPDTVTASILVAANGSGDVLTVAEAVAAAEDGTTILIGPGVYPEAVRTSKSLTFRGTGDDRSDVVIKGARPATPAIGVRNTGVVIEHLTIDLADPPTDLYPESDFLPAGIEIVGGPATVDDIEFVGDPVAGCALVIDSSLLPPSVEPTWAIRNSSFEGGAAGLCAGPAGTLTVANSAFADLRTAMRVSGETVTVTDSSFARNDVAIATGPVPAPSHVVVQGNAFTTNGTGVRADRGLFDVIDNRFEGGSVGIEFDQGAEGSVVRNTITGAETGLVIRQSSPVVDGNDISGSGRLGMSIEGEAGPTLTGNTVCQNGEGISVDLDAQPVIDESNQICGVGPAATQ